MLRQVTRGLGKVKQVTPSTWAGLFYSDSERAKDDSSAQMEVRRVSGAIRVSVQAVPLVLNPVIIRLRGGGERHRSGTQKDAGLAKVRPIAI